MILKCSGIVVKWKPYATYKQNKHQNYWYFVRPKQKTRLSENRAQSLHTDKMEALIHRKIKNVDISLDRSKKTIFQKVCTLTSLGWHTLARKGPARIVEKKLAGAKSPLPGRICDAAGTLPGCCRGAFVRSWAPQDAFAPTCAGLQREQQFWRNHLLASTCGLKTDTLHTF